MPDLASSRKARSGIIRVFVGGSESIVWRAFFMAIGTMLCILGVECLLIDSATFAAERPGPAAQAPAWFNPRTDVRSQSRDPSTGVDRLEPAGLRSCGPLVCNFPAQAMGSS